LLEPFDQPFRFIQDPLSGLLVELLGQYPEILGIPGGDADIVNPLEKNPSDDPEGPTRISAPGGSSYESWEVYHPDISVPRLPSASFQSPDGT
jgi:hypothetical protein